MSISQRIGLLRRPAKSLLLRTLRGFTLVELMVAVTIGLLIVAALLALYLNITRTNTEMAKANSLIENGRFAIQLIQNDLIHAGFWGGACTSVRRSYVCSSTDRCTQRNRSQSLPGLLAT